MCGQCDLKICSVKNILVGPIEDTDSIGHF